ncbi:hypothetical protein, partial [Carboxylicivirga linearis]
MKKLILIVSLFLMIVSMKAGNKIKVNTDNFVHLMCHSTISYVQVGDAEKLLAEPLEHYPHVLRFKALQEFEGKCSM